jgi:hypothetical protein
MTANIVAAAFDAMADSCDSIFTGTPIGGLQRLAVCAKARHVFPAGDCVFEFNRNTGQSALFLVQPRLERV